MNHETFPFALLALIGVFLASGGLIAGTLSRVLFQGVRRAWPCLLAVAVYGVAFLFQPPAPLQAVVTFSGMTAWEALRFSALGIGIAFIALDYFKVLCKLDRAEQGRGERAH